MDGLRQSVIRMIAGKHIPVNTGKFQNDMVSLHSVDDVLTLLIHLGYLTYDFDTKNASNAPPQINEKHYTEKLTAFSGEILLVGISYDENKGHSCIIEKIVK